MSCCSFFFPELSVALHIFLLIFLTTVPGEYLNKHSRRGFNKLQSYIWVCTWLFYCYTYRNWNHHDMKTVSLRCQWMLLWHAIVSVKGLIVEVEWDIFHCINGFFLICQTFCRLRWKKDEKNSSCNDHSVSQWTLHAWTTHWCSFWGPYRNSGACTSFKRTDEVLLFCHLRWTRLFAHRADKD